MRRASVKASLALVGEELEAKREVCLHLFDGIIESIEGWASCPTDAIGGDAVLTPQPINAHIHSADNAFPEFGSDGKLEDLVAPPSGLKHRLLSATPPERLVTAIAEAYRIALSAGTGLIVDFREGGGAGCQLARLAREETGADVLILGRPGPGWPEGCDGLGAPSPLYYEDFERLVQLHRPAMTHVAETRESREAGDLERALKAGVDAIVHGTHLSEEDLMALAERGVGLILCPSSNLWHSIGIPPIAKAIELGVRISLGSDNAAWLPPNVWLEARTALLLARAQGLKGESVAREILRGIFVHGYLMAGRRPPVIEEGEPYSMLLLWDGGLGMSKAADPYSAIAKRAVLAKITRIEADDERTPAERWGG